MTEISQELAQDAITLLRRFQIEDRGIHFFPNLEADVVEFLRRLPDSDLIEARRLAADNFYRGVGDSVMQGKYDDSGDIVRLCLVAIKRGRELALSEKDGE